MFCISIFDSVEKIIQEEYQSMDSIFYKYGEDEDRDAFINARKQKKMRFLTKREQHYLL